MNTKAHISVFLALTFVMFFARVAVAVPVVIDKYSIELFARGIKN